MMKETDYLKVSPLNLASAALIGADFEKSSYGTGCLLIRGGHVEIC